MDESNRHDRRRNSKFAMSNSDLTYKDRKEEEGKKNHKRSCVIGKSGRKKRSKPRRRKK